MKLRKFLRLVEIETKVASILPMINGYLYSRLYYGGLRPLSSLLFFLSLLSMDMATTALNHYSDQGRDKLRQGYGYEVHNPMMSEGLDRKKAKTTIITLYLISFVLGLALVFDSHILVLFLGLFSGFLAIVYSKGPLPLNHTPLGEVVSGFLMGGIIFFLAVFIQNPSSQWIVYNEASITIRLDVLLRLFSVSSPLMLGIAGIMLANNIADLEEDLANGRYTLVSYLGREKSLGLFLFIELAMVGIFIPLMLLRIFPSWGVLVLLSGPYIYSNAKAFGRDPSKERTFGLSVKNFIITAGLMALSLLGGLVL